MLNFYDAKAKINGSKNYPNIKGEVTFKQTREGILVTAKINGLPHSIGKCGNRIFGFHIHEGSSCTGNANDPFADVRYAL